MPKDLYFHPLFFGMQMLHLPSLSYIYSSVFTNLQNICNSSSVNDNFFFSDLDSLETNEIHSF